MTGVVCINDHQALELWAVADEMGIRVPDDLSIIGVDNIPEGAARGLSSIGYSPVEIGRLAVDSLVTLMKGATETVGGRAVQVQLVERTSVVARAKARRRIGGVTRPL